MLISILRLNLVLGIPPEFHGGVHLLIYTVIRHRVSLEFIGSQLRTDGVHYESPPAQGQLTSL